MSERATKGELSSKVTFTRTRRLRKRKLNFASANIVPTGHIASDYAQRYGFPTSAIINGVETTLDGSGQKIAFIELGGGYSSDELSSFTQITGVPINNIQRVLVGEGITGEPDGNGADGADGEVLLDIETAAAVVPNANFFVYFAENTNDGFLAAVSKAVDDDVHLISISWGIAEDLLIEGDATIWNRFHDVFELAKKKNITVLASSGDQGVADMPLYDQNGNQIWDGQIHVNHPASDPLVISCGGTQINNINGVLTDVVWSDGKSEGTGGGFSKSSPLPDYQKGIVKNPNNPEVDSEFRGVPDISFSATGYYVFVDNNDENSGGTSAVTPLFAALLARINQALGAPVGYITPLLYANRASLFSDVTIGNNTLSDFNVPGYNAAPGWNAATGLGVLNGQKLLALLSNNIPNNNNN